MSYFCGFQNRQQLQQYDQLIQLLLVTLHKRLVKFYQNEECDELSFRNIFQRIVSGMKALESQKYMPPRFSETLKVLIDLLQIEEQEQNDQFFRSDGFELISKQANFVLSSERNKIDYKIKVDPQEMPPYPIIQREKTECLNPYGKIPKIDQSGIEKQKKVDNFQSQATTPPSKLSEQPLQENVSKELIYQIEENVTRNVLDRLGDSRRCKKKKQKTKSNSFQFRQILLTTNDRANQSFQSTRRKFIV